MKFQETIRERFSIDYWMLFPEMTEKKPLCNDVLNLNSDLIVLFNQLNYMKDSF